MKKVAIIALLFISLVATFLLSPLHIQENQQWVFYDNTGEIVYSWLVKDYDKTKFKYLTVSVANFDDGDAVILDDGTRGEIWDISLNGNTLNIDSTEQTLSQNNKIKTFYKLLKYADCDYSNSQTIPIPGTCKDSDNGINIYEKGTVYSNDGSNTDLCVLKLGT